MKKSSEPPSIPDFSGRWVLDRTELLEEYMKQSLGKGTIHGSDVISKFMLNLLFLFFVYVT